MQPLGPTISATRVGQHPNPSVSDLHGPTWPTRMIGKARHSELIANGNDANSALCAIGIHCDGRTLRTVRCLVLHKARSSRWRTYHEKARYAWDYGWGRNIDCG